jgi:hypothetical protein
LCRYFCIKALQENKVKAFIAVTAYFYLHHLGEASEKFIQPSTPELMEEKK